jgi:hypothetical protein
MLLAGPWGYSQVLIGTPLSFGTPRPAPQAILELASINQGLLLPRVVDTNAVAGGGIAGLMIYATKDNKLYMYNGTAWIPACYCNGSGIAAVTGSIGSIANCPGTVSGTFTQGVAGSGTITLNYSGGNGGSYAAMSVASTGATGLTAQLAAGIFAGGSGSLVFAVTGTPSGSGIAAFPVTVGGQSCAMVIMVGGAGITGPDGLTYGIITSPVTGATWLDRNLGATGVATNMNDAAGFGGYFQWGKSSSAGFTVITATGGTNDWSSPQNNNLWQGVNGVNNPCPAGFHVPTQAEWAAENITNATVGFNNLKLTLAGTRGFNGSAAGGVGQIGQYWSSGSVMVQTSFSPVINAYGSYALYFTSMSSANSGYSRGLGSSVRCKK